MNKRILKCGSSVYAVGEEGSLADLQEKAGRCSMCSTERCEYQHEYTTAGGLRCPHCGEAKQ